MPAGDAVTVPRAGARRADRQRRAASGANVAVTRAPSIVTVQAPVPVHAPLQPANDVPQPVLAVSVTGVPWAKVSEQSAAQLMPEASS